MIPFEDRFSIAPFGLRMPGFFFFPGCCGCGVDACDIFSDDFSTDTLASNYTTDSGTWTVGGGTLSTTSSDARIRRSSDPSGNQASVYCKVTCQSVDDVARIYFLWSSTTDHWYAEVQAGATNGAFRLYRNDGTVSQIQLENAIPGYTAGETCDIRICLDVTLIGISFATVILANVTYNEITVVEKYIQLNMEPSGRIAGLGTGTITSGVAFDDFSMKLAPNDAPERASCPTCQEEGDLCDDRIFAYGTRPTEIMVDIDPAWTRDDSCDCVQFNSPTTYVLTLVSDTDCSYELDGLPPFCGATGNSKLRLAFDMPNLDFSIFIALGWTEDNSASGERWSVTLTDQKQIDGTTLDLTLTWDGDGINCGGSGGTVRVYV